MLPNPWLDYYPSDRPGTCPGSQTQFLLYMSSIVKVTGLFYYFDSVLVLMIKSRDVRRRNRHIEDVFVLQELRLVLGAVKPAL